jgi:excisionase family DNA binding protein
MLTVPEAARRVHKDPETVRRWIRSGKLRSHRIGTQHLIDEDDLSALEGSIGSLPFPRSWGKTRSGRAPIDFVRMVRRSRAAH